MGTSRDYDGSPNWSSTKAQITAAGAEGEPSSEQAEKVLAAFVQQLARTEVGGFGPKYSPSASGGTSRSSGAKGRIGGGGGGGRGGGGRKGGGIAGGGARQVAANIGNFISTVAKVGLAKALEAIGLKSCEGKNATEVTLALQEALGGPSSLVDQEDLRAGLGNLMEELMGAATDFTELEEAFQEAAANLGHIIERLFSHYIFERFCTLHYANLMNRHGTENAQSFFQGIKDYISEKMKLTGQEKKLGDVDWKGTEGAGVVEAILTETLEIFSVAS